MPPRRWCSGHWGWFWGGGHEYQAVHHRKSKKKIGEAKGEYGIVLLFNKFAIAKNKTFDIDMIEKNGGRNFNLKIDFETFYYQMKPL